MASKSTTDQQSALTELFQDELKDIYWAEKHLVKNLPKLAKGATSPELKTAFEKHLAETEGHVTRLEQVFAAIGEEPSAKKCQAMDGLVKEAKELLEDTDEGTLTRDAALISAAQKVEHYEIASYGTLKTMAGVLGFTKAVSLLDQTLSEEKKTDELLTQIAENSVNELASSESA
ncbi:YciE/YciF ferroxidase family protein [Spirosoma gilvum]